MKKILKNWKIIIYTIISTVILLFFSTHLWINQKYWFNNFPLAQSQFFTIEYKADNTSYKPDLETPKLYWFKYNEKDKITITNKEIINNEKKQNYRAIYPFFREFEKIKLVANENGQVIFSFVKQINVGSFSVNDENIIPNEDKEYIFNVKKGEIYNISFISKRYLEKNVNFTDEINYIALSIWGILYLLIFGYLFHELEKINNKKEKFKNYIKTNKLSIILFISIFLLYFLLNINSITNIDLLAGYNTFYSADSNLSLVAIMHSSSRRFHPYFFLAIYPFFDLLFFITHNFIFSLMVIFSALASLTVVILEKTLKLIIPNSRKLTILLALIFGFSYAQIVMTYTFDIYTITGFYLSLFVYLVIKYFKNGKLTIKRAFLLSILTALTFGVTFPNILTFLIIIIPLLIYKKNFKGLSIYLIITIALILLFSSLKILTYPKTTTHIFYDKTQKEMRKWWQFDFDKNYVNFENETLFRPIMALDVNNSKITNHIMVGFWYFFALIIIWGLFYSYKKTDDSNKKDKILFNSIILALLLNFYYNFCWDSVNGFIFSQNHLVLWFSTFAYAVKFIGDNTKNKELKVFILSGIILLFLIIELPVNIIDSKRLQKEAIEKQPMDYTLFMQN